MSSAGIAVGAVSEDVEGTEPSGSGTVPPAAAGAEASPREGCAASARVDVAVPSTAAPPPPPAEPAPPRDGGAPPRARMSSSISTVRSR